MAGEELQVYEYLVVARASRVYLLAHVAQFAGEHQFHLRVNVLDAFLYHELAPLALFINAFQLGQQHGQLVLADEPDTLEHGDVGHRAQHVVWCQIEVHLAVASHSEPLYLGVNLKVFFPQFHNIKVKSEE